MSEIRVSENAPVRVLVVDDSEDQLQLFRTYFERLGCEVAVAATANDAMLAWDIARPDLTVIDLVLPGMDGWELAAHLRALHPGCAIAITSVLGEEHYPEGHVVLPKPVTNLQVREALEATVPRWKAA